MLEAGADPAAQRADDFAGVIMMECVGGGPGLASARETALLGREAGRLPGAGMEIREYRTPGFRRPKVPRIAAPILPILPVRLLVSELAGRRGVPIGELRRHRDDTKVA